MLEVNENFNHESIPGEAMIEEDNNDNIIDINIIDIIWDYKEQVHIDNGNCTSDDSNYNKDSQNDEDKEAHQDVDDENEMILEEWGIPVNQLGNDGDTLDREEQDNEVHSNDINKNNKK